MNESKSKGMEVLCCMNTVSTLALPLFLLHILFFLLSLVPFPSACAMHIVYLSTREQQDIKCFASPSPSASLFLSVLYSFFTRSLAFWQLKAKNNNGIEKQRTGRVADTVLWFCACFSFMLSGSWMSPQNKNTNKNIIDAEQERSKWRRGKPSFRHPFHPEACIRLSTSIDWRIGHANKVFFTSSSLPSTFILSYPL